MYYNKACDSLHIKSCERRIVMEEILSFFGDTKQEIERQRLSSNIICTEFGCGTLDCSNSLSCITMHGNC